MEIQETKKQRKERIRNHFICIIPFSRKDLLSGETPEKNFLVKRKTLNPESISKLCGFRCCFLREDVTNKVLFPKFWKKTCYKEPIKYFAHEERIDICAFSCDKGLSRTLYFINIPEVVTEADLRIWIQKHFNSLVKEIDKPLLNIIGETQVVQSKSKVDQLLLSEKFDLEMIPHSRIYTSTKRNTWLFQTSSNALALAMVNYTKWSSLDLKKEDEGLIPVACDEDHGSDIINMALVGLIPALPDRCYQNNMKIVEEEVMTHVVGFVKPSETKLKFNVDVDAHFNELYLGSLSASEYSFGQICDDKDTETKILVETTKLFVEQIVDKENNESILLNVSRKHNKEIYFLQHTTFSKWNTHLSHRYFVRLPTDNFDGFICYCGDMIDKIYHSYGTFIQISTKMRFMVQGEFVFGLIQPGAIHYSITKKPSLTKEKIKADLKLGVDWLISEIKDSNQPNFLTKSSCIKLRKEMNKLNKDILPLLYE